jgi:hypothetical protein
MFHVEHSVENPANKEDVRLGVPFWEGSQE